MTNPAQQLVQSAMQVHQSGDLKRAKSLYSDILKLSPAHPDALHLYGLVCHQLGDHLTAVEYIAKAVQLVPEQAVLRNNLADAMHRAGQFDEAIFQLQKALELRPGYAGAHQNLASIYLATSQHELALHHCKQAVELDGTRPEAWFNLGLCWLDHVNLQASADAFRQALVLRPDYQAAVTSLLYVLNLLPQQDPQAIAQEHMRIASAAFDSSRIQTSARAPNQLVRIGYVSGDFRHHAVSQFFEPVLQHHNKQQFEIYCYSDVSHADETTKRIQASADHWRDMRGRNNDEFLRQVYDDGIDILVDLAGYTRDNRMPVFARQAAPLQLGWLGFPNTSGLNAMNYRIVDSVTEPANQTNFGSEQLLRLPTGFACYRPPEQTPEVAQAPLLRNGYVTLGSLHKLEKLNPQVIELWAGLLTDNPDTRLLIARDNLDSWQQKRLLAEFVSHNIGADRLVFRQLNDPDLDFWDLFAEIDIYLDVFPWSGHTMACCALWMGVPVVSLFGNTHAGRMVASVLDQLKLNELSATDQQAYGWIVNRLCRDQQALQTYRSELRSRFKASPLRDEAGFTRELEKQYLQILKN